MFMPAALLQALGGLNMQTLSAAHCQRTLLCVSHEAPQFKAIAQQLNSDGFEYKLAPAPHDWTYVDKFGGILMPHPNIQAIVDWMS